MFTMRDIIKVQILTALFLFCIFNYSFAQQRSYSIPHESGERYSREDSMEHYEQGKQFYSQGRYDDARNEFEKALDSINPPQPGVLEKAPTQTKALEIVPPTAPKATTVTKTKSKEEKGAKGVQGGKEAAVTAVATPVEESGEREYYIDSGDVLDISVWQIPDLSKSEVIVRPDGKISYPLIGDIKAQGRTLTQLDDIITDKLKTYVKAPQVSIMIRSFGAQANKVVVLGEVLSPGVYKFSGPPSIAELIASAGGYTKYAVLNSIMVISGDYRSKPDITRVNFAQVIKNGKLSENIPLKPNDIVYVPRSFIGKMNVFMEVIQPAISEYMQTLDARHFHNVMHRNQ
jgi:polysaccharide biosynthesis/export protein